MGEVVLLVGENNPYGADPEMALYHLPVNASGDRLRRILGLHPIDYLALRRANLCVGGWSMKAARARAEELHMVEPWPDVVVALGRKVATAFGYDGPLLARTEVDVGSVFDLVALPHPSGLNRAWNVLGAVERARALLREVAPGVPWGEADRDEEPTERDCVYCRTQPDDPGPCECSHAPCVHDRLREVAP